MKTAILILLSLTLIVVIDGHGAKRSRLVMVSTADLDTLIPGLTVEISPSGPREYAWFFVHMPDSVDCPEPPVVSIQIGGVPGDAASSDLWCPMEPHERGEPRCRAGLLCSKVGESYLVFETRNDKYGLSIWESFIESTGAIIVGTLAYRDTCANNDWTTADIRVDRVLKGNSDEIYRIPVFVKMDPDGMKGIWLLQREKWEGCDEDVNFRKIMWVPEHRAAAFERRLEHYLRSG